MRKTFVSILLLCYFAFTSGVLISQHFCMNQLDSAGLFAEKKDTCGRCGMEVDDSNGCCKDEVKLVKLDEEQKASTAFIIEAPASEAIITELSSFIYAAVLQPEQRAFIATGPPPLLKGQDIHLLNSVFRI